MNGAWAAIQLHLLVVEVNLDVTVPETEVENAEERHGQVWLELG